ncbi:TROVE domain-containing protein [Fimbriimonas ginsengisoli]|uniref:60 kDa SS-A/Ro ribonucleoprotein n=1 Tax=Fimbriimonas ginsengisoli Gsoil 348 TaxID=661478 RepID=A0A068NYR1_FIMGI|nr:TROVE domain-containing protein [Fimbriimonas ginsengisoli]AIE87264.1 60 kDa SS-A/Ro ribonucleoprotein [Fimbriimonas ginsengisoli Gsoil 348]
MNYAKLFNRATTHQSMPIPGSGQVLNHAGGFVYEVDGWTVLDRFLILGSEAGTFYVAPQKLTQENAQNVLKLIHEDGERVVRRIVEVSVAGRAPKNDSAIFALGLCASFGNDRTRAEALLALPSVCRTGTHLFQFAAVVDGLRGWGRGLRRAIGAWYNAKPVQELELQLVKYQQRDGWSNRDLLRLAHPKPESEAHRDLYKWVVSGADAPAGSKRIEAMQRLKGMTDAAEAAKVITEARLPREAVPTELLNKAEVWEALMTDMPMTAMVRNLATMTRVGLLTPKSEATKTVKMRLADAERIPRARVHPMALLFALRTYASGHGLRGSAEWTPVTSIVDALDSAFYLAFANVEPTNKRYLLGMDVSGSMSNAFIAGTAMTAAEASAAMAMVTVATEEAVTPMAFSTIFTPLSLSKRMRLDQATNSMRGLPFAGTDCAQPMIYAMERKLPIDVFVVYTDSETWHGMIHPSQALVQYRQMMGIDAKLVVVGMTATKFSIANPNDRGMLDVVGFDASVPSVMAEFVGGGR